VVSTKLVNCEYTFGAIMDVGQKVRVCRIRDRVDASISSKLGKVGVVKGYKMTDGSGIGLLVYFDDNVLTWFFEDELEPVQ
jgi:Protein of unknown function (DUF2862)